MQLRIATLCSIFIDSYRIKWQVINYNDKEIIAILLRNKFWNSFTHIRIRVQPQLGFCTQCSIFSFHRKQSERILAFLWISIYKKHQKRWLGGVLCVVCINHSRNIVENVVDFWIHAFENYKQWSVDWTTQGRQEGVFAIWNSMFAHAHALTITITIVLCHCW